MESRESLIQSFKELRAEHSRFWESLPNNEFFTTDGTHWSAAENVSHLATSTRTVAKAMRLPKWLLRILFGTADRNRSFDEIHNAYLARLNQGAQAGKYTPPPESAVKNAEQRRAELMHDWQAAWDSLLKSLESWTDEQLGRLRLPHPILGKLSVREMLYFTLYHHQHHQGNVARRRGVA